MNKHTAYLDLPGYEQMEIPIPEDGVLWDGSLEPPESVKKITEWAGEFAKLWTESQSYWRYWHLGRLRKNFNPPERWEVVQDKRRNPAPLGRNTYLYKARKIKSLARSTHTGITPHNAVNENGTKQCRHTFEITVARCAPCGGYNTKCENYKENDAADTKYRSLT